jgi:purine nucleosidase
VWIDVDPSVGLPGKDVDDGVALLMALGSPELDVVGVSVSYGNAPRDDGLAITAALLTVRGAAVPVHRGAAAAGDAAPEAVAALATALEQGPLTLLALGPLTTPAALLRARPDLAPRLTDVVFVGGRLPGQKLQTGDHVHRDFNVEQDGDAVAAVLASPVPLTLAPWALSRQVWLGQDTLTAWASGPPAAAWLAERSGSWLTLWRDRFGVDGFNPFDALAVELVVRPSAITCHPAGAALLTLPDDRGRPDPAPKPYLHVTPDGPGRPVRWCDAAAPDVAADITARVAR